MFTVQSELDSKSCIIPCWPLKVMSLTARLISSVTCFLGRQLLLHLPLRLRKLPGFPVFFNCGTDPYGGLSFREGQGALTLTNAHYRKG